MRFFCARMTLLLLDCEFLPDDSWVLSCKFCGSCFMNDCVPVFKALEAGVRDYLAVLLFLL